MVLRVAVGSSNPVKVEAARRGFEEFFGEAVVKAVPVETVLQPIGVEEVIRCAVKRGHEAVRSGSWDYGVGIEAGLIRAPWTITGYVDQHVCAVVDGGGAVTLGFSMGFEFPVEVIQGILSGGTREAEEVMERISGIEGIGDKIGAIGYLSKTKVTRMDLCIQSVIAALIPRTWPQLYRAKWHQAEEILGERF